MHCWINFINNKNNLNNHRIWQKGLKLNNDPELELDTILDANFDYCNKEYAKCISKAGLTAIDNPKRKLFDHQGEEEKDKLTEIFKHDLKDATQKLNGKSFMDLVSLLNNKNE